MRKSSISRWIVLCFTGVFILSLAISSVANYLENRRSVTENADSEAIRLLEIIQIVMDDEVNFSELSDPNSETYQQTYDTMAFLVEVYEADRLTMYTILPETKERRLILTVTTDDAENYFLGLEGDSPAKEPAEEPPAAAPDYPLQSAEEDWLKGEATSYGSLRSNKTITWIMGRCNPETDAKYLVSLDIGIEPQNKAVLNSFLWDITPIGLALLLGMVILLILVRRRIIRPIGIISDSMRKFAEDGSRKPEPLRLQARDEIGEIAAAYTKMTEDISTYVNSIETLTKDKLETDVQLDVARRIQYGLVPGKTRLTGDGFDACAITQPAKAVGGDFYDCFRRDAQSVCVVMGDVSGKGISAAIFMAMAKTMIREKMMAGLSPAKALNQANRELCAQNPEGLFATVFTAVLNLRTGELRYANAGHTRPVLLGDNPAMYEPDPGTALGLFEDAGIRDYTLRLGPSEGILLYTDGVTESVDPENRFFGEERLLEALRSVPRGTDAEEVLACVNGAVSAFCGGREPFDDLAGLALFYLPAAGKGRTLPVALSSFEEIKKTVFAAAGETPETRKALLACDETLANIVGYSGATELAFSCEKVGDELKIVFSDNGKPFDPSRAKIEEKAFEELEFGGMGISLMQQTAAEMHYERRQDRNELEMRFRLGEAPE